jgi:hypothetical protein
LQIPKEALIEDEKNQRYSTFRKRKDQPIYEALSDQDPRMQKICNQKAI